MPKMYAGGGEAKQPRPANPIPTKEDLGTDEVAIRIHDDLDDWGRCQFTAFWLDDHLTPDGVRGQVFFANLSEFAAREGGRGKQVTALDECTRKLLDGLGPNRE